MIQYITGDATEPIDNGEKLIVHICNDMGAWGAGFVLALSRKWHEPEQSYQAWHRRGHKFELGEIQVVQVEEGLSVINMIAQRGLGPMAIRYPALVQCLRKVHEIARVSDASVHMPRIGCGLAGGNWGIVGVIVGRTLKDIPVTVYDW